MVKGKRIQNKNYQNKTEVKLQRSCSGVGSHYPRTHATGEQNEHFLYLRKKLETVPQTAQPARPLV